MDKVHKNLLDLLGRRIRSLREMKGWTQEMLGDHADVNPKYLGEVERGNQNPSFEILAKIAGALKIEPMELLRFQHEISDRKEIEKRIKQIIKTIPDDSLQDLLSVLGVLFPVHGV